MCSLEELALDLFVEEQFPEDLPVRISEEKLTLVIERLLRSEGLVGRVGISIVFTDDETIRKLNATYRATDAPTDVLSFPFSRSDDEIEFRTPVELGQYLGDVVISLPRAQEQAAEYGHSLQREICYLAAHGTLHLLGYEHDSLEGQTLMREKEEAALFDLPRSADEDAKTTD